LVSWCKKNINQEGLFMPECNQYSSVRRILWAVLGINWGIAAAKITIGYAAGSISLLADGIHSLSDGVSNIIGLFAMKVAGKPADSDHPYGHKKYETMAALAIAGLLLMASMNIMTEGVKRLFYPSIPQVSWASIVIMLITIGINWAVMYYEYAKGKALKSDVLVADAMHTRSDIFISSGVLITLLGVRYGITWIDQVASLGIAVCIAWAAWDIIKQCAVVLCDEIGVSPEEIRQIVMEVDGVLECHKIRSRGREDHLFLDLHVLVAQECSLLQAHTISHHVENAIRKRFQCIGDVVVHIEPCTEEELALHKDRRSVTR
jgi:cation diffusion facilitator family transporter